MAVFTQDISYRESQHASTMKRIPIGCPLYILVIRRKSRYLYTEEATQSWERKKARTERVEAAQSLLLLSDTSTVEPVPDIVEAEQEGVATQTDLTSASLQDMQEQLNWCHQVINYFTMRFSPTVATFTKESLGNNETVKFYTGLSNLKVLKAVFDLVKNSMPSSGVTKLSSFQEFMATLVTGQASTRL